MIAGRRRRSSAPLAESGAERSFGESKSERNRKGRE
jgi:hypothetical protein